MAMNNPMSTPGPRLLDNHIMDISSYFFFLFTTGTSILLQHFHSKPTYCRKSYGLGFRVQDFVADV